MVEIVANKNTLSSILLGKGIYVPWRGQSNMIIRIPFEEWLEYVHENVDILKHRVPINYEYIVQNKNPLREYRYFMFECSWAFYNEVMVSANQGVDATIILPKFETEVEESLTKILDKVDEIPEESFQKYYRNLINAKPTCTYVPLPNLSKHNFLCFQVCCYLQSYAFGNVTEFNINWR